MHVNDAVDGPVVVDFEYSQRRFVIDPVASPEAWLASRFGRKADADDGADEIDTIDAVPEPMA